MLLEFLKVDSFYTFAVYAFYLTAYIQKLFSKITKKKKKKKISEITSCKNAFFKDYLFFLCLVWWKQKIMAAQAPLSSGILMKLPKLVKTAISSFYHLLDTLVTWVTDSHLMVTYIFILDLVGSILLINDLASDPTENFQP